MVYGCAQYPLPIHNRMEASSGLLCGKSEPLSLVVVLSLFYSFPELTLSNKESIAAKRAILFMLWRLTAFQLFGAAQLSRVSRQRSTSSILLII
jgi:hypothetical protein